LKSLLFKSEIRNRRVSKIKSKLYHKLKKKDKDREQKKLLDHLEQIDPEAAAAYRDKEELKYAEERLRVRHGA
jgi:U3 small nucleolar RNA-associated protein 14